jgi:hypothetical protein
MGELAIRAEGLGKLYRIRADERYDTLRDVIANSFWTPLLQFKSKIKSEVGRIGQNRESQSSRPTAHQWSPAGRVHLGP